MARLILALPDLYPTRLDRDSLASLPRLPALERWLRESEFAADAKDWRGRLRDLLCGPDHRARALAALASAAVAGLGEHTAVWLATPVHYVAGLHTLRLHPSGLLALQEDEQKILATDFARVFAGSGWSLHATRRREMVLTHPRESQAAAHNDDPARWLGADPTPGLIATGRSPAVRALNAEIEMWLHEHPVNLARVHRGDLSASALWLWGGGQAMAAAPGAAAPGAVLTSAAGSAWTAWADDLFVDGLSVLTQGSVRSGAPADMWASMGHGAGQNEGHVTLVLAPCGALDVDALRALDLEWVAPTLDHWRCGEYDSASLWVGTQAATLRRFSIRQFCRRARRSRHWAESVLQC